MEIDLKHLHHAYLVVGDPKIASASLLDAFEESGESLTTSPDFFQYPEPLFGIDEARKLSESALRRAFGLRKIFLLTPEKITLEAQNALLKTFEEPIPSTHFFLCVTDVNSVIPTLRSRMQVLQTERSSGGTEAEKFLKLSIKDRLNFSKKFADDERNLPVFLDEILAYLKKMGADLEKIEKVYKARLVSADRGTAPRLILEHLALVL